MKTFEPGEVRSITEILDSTLHVKAIREENEELERKLEIAIQVAAQAAIDSGRWQTENVNLKKKIVEMEGRIKELREMLDAKGKQLGLGSP